MTQTEAVILSTPDGGNFAVVNIKGKTQAEAEKAMHLPLQEEFSEEVDKVTFEDFGMLDIVGNTTLEVTSDGEEAIRLINVERTWIY